MLKNNEIIPVFKARSGASGLDQDNFSGLVNDSISQNVLIVGNDSKYKTFTDAMDFIQSLNPQKVEFGDIYGGVAVINQYNDIVNFIGMTNSFNFFGNDDPITYPFWIEFNDNGNLYLVDKLMSGASMRLMSGFDDASIAGAPYKLYRLPEYSIFLTPNDHILDKDYDLKEKELCLSITGCGKTVSSIKEISGSIQPPDAGSFEISNLSVNGSTFTVMLNGATDNEKSKYGRYLSMDNVILTKNDVLGGTDVVNLAAASARLNNIDISAVGDVFIVIADKLVANNITVSSENMASNGFAFRCYDCQCTKEWLLSNLYSEATSGTGGIWIRKVTTDVIVSKSVFIHNTLSQNKITVENQSGTIDKLTVFSKNNTLLSFECDAATVESTNDSKKDGSVLDAPTLNNGGVVN